MAEMRRKKRRSSNDFLWVLIILLIICLGVLGRQEYKIYQINKEMSATQQRVDELNILKNWRVKTIIWLARTKYRCL